MLCRLQCLKGVCGFEANATEAHPSRTVIATIPRKVGPNAIFSLVREQNRIWEGYECELRHDKIGFKFKRKSLCSRPALSTTIAFANNLLTRDTVFKHNLSSTLSSRQKASSATRHCKGGIFSLSGLAETVDHPLHLTKN
jgi:hypothetical protein